MNGNVQGGIKMAGMNGNWMIKEHLFGDDEYICSECGYKSESAEDYCPNCYAKMEYEDYDPVWVDEAFFLDEFFGDDF